MSWLFFIDESGHDHKNMPLEVRGGIAIHAGKLWSFIQGWQRLERDAFGIYLREFGKEGKGYKLLDRDRMRWAAQASAMSEGDRRKNIRSFLEKGRQHIGPTSVEFAAYGQGCLEMARGVFDLLIAHDAQLFASAIPKGVRPPADFHEIDYLRKDQVFLSERFSYFLEARAEHGLIVMDESEKALDRKFVSRMESYFTRTSTGRNRSYWIVPVPLFVSSDMTYAVQAADSCLYAINWGFRLPSWGALDKRDDIAAEFGRKLRRLQWAGEGHRDGQSFRTWGICIRPGSLFQQVLRTKKEAMLPPISRTGFRQDRASEGKMGVKTSNNAVRPVRVLAFDKTPETNWRLAWHQDRVIAVRERCDVPGFGSWSVKDGVPHTEPPLSVLQAMFSLRLHLDPCDRDNGALKIVPGSWRGRLKEADVRRLAASQPPASARRVKPATMMLFGDAKKMTEDIVKAL